MDISCSESPDAPLEDCTAICRTGIPWREGSDDCRSARWAYYDCRAAVESCEVWDIGYGQGDTCDAAYEEQLSACAEVSRRG